MRINSIFRRETRLVEEQNDLNVYVQQIDSNTIQAEPLPTMYVAKIQTKVTLMGWVTIWSMSCDIIDGDTRNHINNEAKQILKMFQGV